MNFQKFEKLPEIPDFSLVLILNIFANIFANIFLNLNCVHEKHGIQDLLLNGKRAGVNTLTWSNLV